MKHKILGIIFLAAVASVIASGVYYWQERQAQTNFNRTFADVNQATTMPIPEIMNWKTYSNGQYGFEFKYPGYLYDKYTNYFLISLESSPLPVELGGAIPEGIVGKDFVTKGYTMTVGISDAKDVSLTPQKDYDVNKLDYPKFNAWETIDRGGLTADHNVLIQIPSLSGKYISLSEMARCGDKDQDDCRGLNPDDLFYSILSTFKSTK